MSALQQAKNTVDSFHQEYMSGHPMFTDEDMESLKWLIEQAKKKSCEIVNSKFSWILRVDGEEILFQGGHNADYFKEHYERLGYEVEIIDDSE